MGLEKWGAAIDHLNFIVDHKAKVIIDSVASLIHLAEYDLGVCYQKLGKESEAQKHYSSVLAMWEYADPELKARFTNSAGVPDPIIHK